VNERIGQRFYFDDPAKRHGPDSPVGASWMTRADREREIAAAQ
jgi:hypothetical protein